MHAMYDIIVTINRPVTGYCSNKDGATHQPYYHLHAIYGTKAFTVLTPSDRNVNQPSPTRGRSVLWA